MSRPICVPLFGPALADPSLSHFDRPLVLRPTPSPSSPHSFGVCLCVPVPFLGSFSFPAAPRFAVATNHAHPRTTGSTCCAGANDGVVPNLIHSRRRRRRRRPPVVLAPRLLSAPSAPCRCLLPPNSWHAAATRRFAHCPAAATAATPARGVRHPARRPADRHPTHNGCGGAFGGC